MPNPQDIFQLAQQTATQVTASPENWRRFLYTAAHNYHTTYLNQLLIHAQRPDATACATMKYWNEQAHRKVMYGSKSIIILQRHQGVPTAKRVFSMTDTVLTGDKAAAPWEVTDAIRPLLMQVNSVGSLMDRATEQVVSLSDRANRVLATSIEDSALNWSHPEDQRFILQELAAQSTLYMICIRLGIPVQEEDFPAFQNVTQFDTSRISLCLGGYVQAAAEPLLDELGHEVMQLARDSVAIQAEPVHNTDTQSPTQTTSREEAVTDDVHEREGLSDSEPELAESQENQPEPVRQDAAGLLGAERAEPVRPDDAGGNAAVELPQDGAGCAADGGQDAARSDAESADARPQDEPSGLGTDVQQPEAAGGGNDPSDAVRSITEEPAAAESEPSPSAFSLPEFPAELLPFLLKADTTSRASNADILSFFSKTPLLIDRLRYIRESYKVVFTELLLDDDKDGEDAYGNVEWASLLYRMDWEELYGIVDGIKCRATGSGMTEEELRQLFASLNIDATTARGQVVAFALSCQGKFVYAQPSSLRGGPGNPSVGINLDCSSFVQYCYWAQNLLFSAGSTAAYRNAADLVSISPSEVQPGDLRVVYASGGEQGHVQMALGGGAWIECCYGYGVAVNMSNTWMESRPCYYFRYAGF